MTTLPHEPFAAGGEPISKLQHPPYPGALRCEQCGWFDGQQNLRVTILICGHTICNSCCCPGPRGGAGGHICHCSEDYYYD